MRLQLLPLSLLTLLSLPVSTLAAASTATSFCKCICFNNSTILYDQLNCLGNAYVGGGVHLNIHVLDFNGNVLQWQGATQVATMLSQSGPFSPCQNIAMVGMPSPAQLLAATGVTLTPHQTSELAVELR